LYHDGRRSILAALKLLLTARPGVTWTLELDERIVELITKFTENIPNIFSLFGFVHLSFCSSTYCVFQLIEQFTFAISIVSINFNTLKLNSKLINLILN